MILFLILESGPVWTPVCRFCEELKYNNSVSHCPASTWSMEPLPVWVANSDHIPYLCNHWAALCFGQRSLSVCLWMKACGWMLWTFNCHVELFLRYCQLWLQFWVLAVGFLLSFNALEMASQVINPSIMARYEFWKGISHYQSLRCESKIIVNKKMLGYFL